MKVEKTEKPARNRLADFPQADKTRPVIAHNGLTVEELEIAENLGYELRDVRFITGKLGAELTMLGVRQGTVVLDDKQLKAALAELSQYAKADTSIGERKETVGVSDDIGSFFAGMGTTTTGAKEGQVETIGSGTDLPPIEKKRGRPKGSIDRKPRLARGSRLSEESQESLEEALKAGFSTFQRESED